MRKPLLLFLPKRMMVLALPLMLSLCSYAATVTSQLSVNMKTDKACYVPGQTVTFVAEGNIPSSAKVRYRYGSHVLLVQDFSEVAKSKQWTWLPPSADYQGYLVELYTEGSGVENILGTIAEMFPAIGNVFHVTALSLTLIITAVQSIRTPTSRARWHISIDCISMVCNSKTGSGCTIDL